MLKWKALKQVCVNIDLNVDRRIGPLDMRVLRTVNQQLLMELSLNFVFQVTKLDITSAMHGCLL